MRGKERNGDRAAREIAGGEGDIWPEEERERNEERVCTAESTAASRTLTFAGVDDGSRRRRLIAVCALTTDFFARPSDACMQ